MESAGSEDMLHRRRETSSREDPPELISDDYKEINEDGIFRQEALEESHTRSVVKGLTWRILATTTTTIIAYVVTGEVNSALQIGFFEFFAKLAIYYIHERIWTRIRL